MPLDKDTLLFGFRSKLTEEQETYVNSMIDNQVTIVNAIAGSGKTTLAVAVARLLQMDLVYIHATVEEGRLGFMPGTEEDKISKYHQPLKDALLEINEDPNRAILNEQNLGRAKAGNFWVQAMSDAFLRGANLKGSKFILIDEAQNFTYNQLRKILTRISDDCKVVLIGHTEQCDLINPNDSGFVPYIHVLKDKPYAQLCHLSKNFRGRLASDSDIPLSSVAYKQTEIELRELAVVNRMKKGAVLV